MNSTRNSTHLNETMKLETRESGDEKLVLDLGNSTKAGNFSKLNELLKDELDVPVVPLGSRGENFIQTYQTSRGVLQFHLGLPGVPRFEEAEKTAVIRETETGAPVKCLSGTHLLAAKRAADRPQDQADIAFLEALKRLGKIT